MNPKTAIYTVKQVLFWNDLTIEQTVLNNQMAENEERAMAMIYGLLNSQGGLNTRELEIASFFNKPLIEVTKGIEKHKTLKYSNSQYSMVYSKIQKQIQTKLAETNEKP
jgi:hypothetical protein